MELVLGSRKESHWVPHGTSLGSTEGAALGNRDGEELQQQKSDKATRGQNDLQTYQDQC